MSDPARRIDDALADRGDAPPSAIGAGVPLVFCDRGDDRCERPIACTAYVVHEPGRGRVWWTRLPDTGQVATHDIGDEGMSRALFEFRMAIARYRRWRPQPRRGTYDAEPASANTQSAPHTALLRAIDVFWQTFDEAPSNHDLCRLTGYKSTASVGYHLRALEAAGLISREHGAPRSTRITDAGRQAIARHRHPEGPHDGIQQLLPLGRCTDADATDPDRGHGHPNPVHGVLRALRRPDPVSPAKRPSGDRR